MPTHTDIEEWMRSYIGELLQLPPGQISIDVNFDRLGLDSTSAVALAGDLEDWLRVEIDPTLPYDYPSISALARKLSEIVRLAA